MPLHLPCCQRAWHVIMRSSTWEGGWHVFLFGPSIILPQKVRITGFEQKREKDDLHWNGTLWLGRWQPTSPPRAHMVCEGGQVLKLFPCHHSLGKQFLLLKLTLESSAYPVPDPPPRAFRIFTHLMFTTIHYIPIWQVRKLRFGSCLLVALPALMACAYDNVGGLLGGEKFSGTSS